jgi:adenine deaminase
MHPETLAKWHINKLVSRLIEKGYNLFDVLRAASLNAVEHYGIKAGLLRPGDPADFIVVDNPEKMNILQTWIDGKCVFDGEKALFSPGEIILISSTAQKLRRQISECRKKARK